MAWKLRETCICLNPPMETEQQQPIPTLQPEPENPDTAAAASPLLDIHTNVVQGLRSLGFICEQRRTPPEPVSVSQDTTAPSLSNIHTKVVQAIRCLGFDCNDNFFDLQRCLVQCVPELCDGENHGEDWTGRPALQLASLISSTAVRCMDHTEEHSQPSHSDPDFTWQAGDQRSS